MHREDAETWVELTFEDKGQDYTIRRSPAYTRLSKRKNKDGAYTATSVAPKASLLLPDGSEMSGRIREIDEKIRAIVGVDRDQFSQIAMIAQGEYIRLLHASSKERKEIFSRIFHTGIYGRIQQKLREADRTLYGRLEDNKTRCEEVIRQVTVPRTEEAVAPEWEERWQSLKERYRTNGAELLAFLHQLSEESRRLEEETGRLEENAIQKLAAGQNHLELVKKENGYWKKRAVWKHLVGRWRLGAGKLPQPMRAGNRSWRIRSGGCRMRFRSMRSRRKNGRHMKLWNISGRL